MGYVRNGRLEGKVAVITGGAGGIGRATGHKMIMEGAAVILLDVLEKELEDIQIDLTSQGGSVLALCVDITNEKQVKKAVRKIVQEFGTIDILVNNAGIVCPAPLEKVVEKDWDDVMAVNLKGSFFCTKAVLPFMKKKGGKIVNIGSRASLGKYDRTVYSATKAGLVGMTRTWALELAKFNICVNYLGPGLISTELFHQVNPANSETTQKLISAIPLQRIGKPEDVANMITFFSSDEASYITGQSVFVCGGLSVHSS